MTTFRLSAFLSIFFVLLRLTFASALSSPLGGGGSGLPVPVDSLPVLGGAGGGGLPSTNSLPLDKLNTVTSSSAGKVVNKLPLSMPKVLGAANAVKAVAGTERIGGLTKAFGTAAPLGGSGGGALGILGANGDSLVRLAKIRRQSLNGRVGQASGIIGESKRGFISALVYVCDCVADVSDGNAGSRHVRKHIPSTAAGAVPARSMWQH